MTQHKQEQWKFLFEFVTVLEIHPLVLLWILQQYRTKMGVEITQNQTKKLDLGIQAFTLIWVDITKAFGV